MRDITEAPTVRDLAHRAHAQQRLFQDTTARGGRNTASAISACLPLLAEPAVHRHARARDVRRGAGGQEHDGGFHRSTVLRLARTLSADEYLVQKEDGTWRLGRAAGWLGACYQATFDVHDIIEPVLRELALEMGESATFYIREGDQRTCIVRVEGPRAVRHHVRIGAALPLLIGGPGRVIMAFSGAQGEGYERIRKNGYCISLGERDPEVSSISVPVFGVNWKLLGGCETLKQIGQGVFKGAGSGRRFVRAEQPV
jgi:hypothetical protein